MPSFANTKAGKGGYWEGFKRRKPEQAKQIEMTCGRDMSNLDDVSAFQIVTSLIRWSENAGTPIGELKNYFLKETNALLSQPGANYEMIFSKLKEEKPLEAQKFGIKPDFTVCNFMLEFLEEDRQKKMGDDMTRRIGQNMGMSPEEIEALAESVNKTSEELNIAPDITNLDREENKLFHLAEEGAKMLDDLIVGISGRLQLSKAGLAEARILCSTIVIELTPDFKNQIDLDVEADRYFLLLHDPTMFDCDNVSDTIGFLNSRIAFYNKEVPEALSLNAIQAMQPDTALARIFNVLYKHPETETPEAIISGEISPNDLVMLRGQLEKVVKYLQNKSRQIRNGISSTDGDKLQKEIEETLMLLFPASKRSEVNQDMAFILTDVILRDLRAGNINSGPFGALPPYIRDKFINLASKIKSYSEGHYDTDDVIEAAQTEVVNKFN